MLVVPEELFKGRISYQIEKPSTMMLIAVFVSLVFLYSLISQRLERIAVTAPIVFTAVGTLIFPVLGLPEGERSIFLRLAEVGLVLILFTDASRTDLQILRRIRHLPVRLLSTGMLLTILLGTLAALVVFPQLSFWEAGILAAILAPTDAGLGQVIVNSPRVPLRIREALNVEAGLNDGLSVPFLMFFLALAQVGGQSPHAGLAQFVIEQLGFGALVGLGIGLVGGGLLGVARRKEWMAKSLQQIALVALPLLCVMASRPIGASMFIAAFVAGLAVKVGFHEAGKQSVEFTEEWGQLLAFVVFFLFGMFVARSLAAIQPGGGVVCRSQPDGGADAPGGNCTDRHAPEPGHGAVHGMVWPAGAGVDRTRAGLPGAGSASARRVSDPALRDDDGARQHLCPRAERRARDRSLCPQDRGAGRQRARASGGRGCKLMCI